jgi:hypothetical protein
MQNQYGKTNQMPIKRQAKTARIAAATLSYKKKKRSRAASTYLQKLKSSLMKLTSTSRLETKFQNIK